MSKILWNGNQFVVEQGSELGLESLHLYSLKSNVNKVKIVCFLKQCDFDLIDYTFYPDSGFKIVKTSEYYLPLKDEGTGFNILFHLLGYILTGKDLDIVESSIKPFLHPVLWGAIKCALINTNNCSWLSPKDVRAYLKCAVNPSGDCGDCQHFESDKKQVITFV